MGWLLWSVVTLGSGGVLILLIVGSERGFVHVPEKMASGVRVNRDADGLGGSWLRGRREGEKRNGCGKRVLSVVSRQN